MTIFVYLIELNGHDGVFEIFSHDGVFLLESV